MNYGRLPLNEQLDAFQDVLLRNQTLAEVLTRAAVLALPGWYLVAGCLYQTVWNIVTGRSAEAGILDYDLAYFDASDLSWEGEDSVIQAGRTLFGDLPVPVQIRNQARVHLWYEQKFRLPACRTTLPRRQSTPSRRPTPASACGLSRETGGGSTLPTVSVTSSTSSRGPTRCWLPGTSTKPRSPGGGGNGLHSACCPGPSRPALAATTDPGQERRGPALLRSVRFAL